MSCGCAGAGTLVRRSGTTPARISWRSSPSRVATQLQRFGARLGLTIGSALEADDPPGAQDLRQVAALRDRTCLFALSQHLGHRERAETDHGYVGSDYRLNQEIDAEILQQSMAWEHMLAAPASAAAQASRSWPSALVSGAAA
jgi:hypothetical protein